ncbi:hypothetical protein PPACK8108_LOCUS13363 [Phakopsora pachyrhizi]|uniref:Uncharacterized protein n=1 Tax=Phakopsora pachyrhizi TaxID=170000 RepID=A0AAV0B856_PHAPC|nr:hypothetical protein PPACK8108_LOCUS13363 [Phakopsora pachyrhizi]
MTSKDRDRNNGLQREHRELEDGLMSRYARTILQSEMGAGDWGKCKEDRRILEDRKELEQTSAEGFAKMIELKQHQEFFNKLERLKKIEDEAEKLLNKIEMWFIKNDIAELKTIEEKLEDFRIADDLKEMTDKDVTAVAANAIQSLLSKDHQNKQQVQEGPKIAVKTESIQSLSPTIVAKSKRNKEKEEDKEEINKLADIARKMMIDQQQALEAMATAKRTGEIEQFFKRFGKGGWGEGAERRAPREVGMKRMAQLERGAKVMWRCSPRSKQLEQSYRSYGLAPDLEVFFSPVFPSSHLSLATYPYRRWSSFGPIEARNESWLSMRLKRNCKCL